MRRTPLRMTILAMSAAAMVACAAPRPEPTPPRVAPTAAATPSPTLAAPPAPTDTPTPAPPPGTPALTEPTPVEAATAEPPAPADLPFAPQVEVVASNLRVPWSLAFAPDGRLFFTERPGRLRVIVDGVLAPEPLAEFDVAAEGEGGLLGIALDPAFADNALLYAMYTYREGGRVWNRVSRYVVQADGLGVEQILVDRIPGAQFHDGGRIAFGPDGRLYVTTGDAREPDLAQDLDSLAGKILRLDPDGSVPADNPFSGSLVFSLGHRNPQGLAWRPSGALYSTEHGPSGEQGLCCRDELNLIEAGANYGWPIVTAAAGDERFVDPVLHSGDDTWAPSGVAVYTGEPLAPWHGSLFFGALRGQHVQRVELAADGRTVLEVERLFEGQYGRIRDVVQGPDGCIYFTTSNRDGRASPAAEDDRILRIVPR